MAAVETIVIGAGPYGLSIAAHLRHAAIDHVVVGQPMASWREAMPAGMFLKSDPFASNLFDPERRYTLERYCEAHKLAYAPRGPALPIGDFIDYADWFQRQAAPEIINTTLKRMCFAQGRFELDFADRAMTAKRVILATGHLAFRHFVKALRPLAAACPDLVSHSADHREFSRFAGRDVVVVGAGQSALESAALLHEAGAQVRLVARAARVEWNPEVEPASPLITRLRRPDTPLGPGWRNVVYAELPRVMHALPRGLRRKLVRKVLGPAGAAWLKGRVVGKVEVLEGRTVVGASESGGRVRLALAGGGGEPVTLHTDHVVDATGYRVKLVRLPYLNAVLRSDIRTEWGAPVLDRAFQCSVPGLYFTGLASALAYGPVMRFVAGAKHPATMITAHLRAGSARTSPAPAAAFDARAAER
jgi:cation diffusion facilitator CzcD-associated flavoprotein CzcO